MKNKNKVVYRTIDGFGIAYLVGGSIGFAGCIIIPAALIFTIHHDFASFIPSIFVTIILIVFIRINPSIHCILRKIVIDNQNKTLFTNADVTFSKKRLQVKPALINIDKVVSVMLYYSFSNSENECLRDVFKKIRGHGVQLLKTSKRYKIVESGWYPIPDWLHIAAFKMIDGNIIKIVLNDLSDKKLHQLIRNIKLINHNIEIIRDNTKIYDK